MYIKYNVKKKLLHLALALSLFTLPTIYCDNSYTNEDIVKAVEAGKSDIVEKILNECPYLAKEEKLVSIAADYNYYNILKLLLKNDADPNDISYSNLFNITPLKRAVRNKHVNIVRLLLINDADPNIKETSGEITLLNFEVVPILNSAIPQWGEDEDVITIVNLLLEYGAQTDPENFERSNHPLHWAATFNCPTIAKILLENGANLNPKGPAGGTPLHYAVSSDSPKVVKVLIEGGADRSIQDDAGRIPAEEEKHLRWDEDGNRVINVAEEEEIKILLETYFPEIK